MRTTYGSPLRLYGEAGWTYGGPPFIPPVHPVTQRLFDSLPGLYQEADVDGLLRRWLSLLVDQLGEVSYLADRIDFVPFDEGGRGGTSDLLDPGTADAVWLAWMAQLVGVRLQMGMTVAQQRAAIAGSSSGQLAGTFGAILAAVRPLLTGTQYVEVLSHYNDDPWQVAIRTVDSESPDDETLLGAVASADAKPAGVLLLRVPYAASWGMVESRYPTWAAAEAAGSWRAVQETRSTP